jgi:hypothetical protein
VEVLILKGDKAVRFDAISQVLIPKKMKRVDSGWWLVSGEEEKIEKTRDRKNPNTCIFARAMIPYWRYCSVTLEARIRGRT